MPTVQACARRLYRAKYAKLRKGHYVGYRTELFDAFTVHLISIHELIPGGGTDKKYVGDVQAESQPRHEFFTDLQDGH